MSAPAVSHPATAPSTRDLRLDFFRGVTMCIIFIAHTPGDSWNDWIPARFGFSSGTELFVFCSGVASAGAFGRVYRKRGWLMGSAKVLRRIWQIYWVQMAMVMASIGLAFLAAPLLGPDALARFAPIAQHGTAAVAALLGLVWLPEFLDILPMYIGILALLPLFEALALVHVRLPIVASAILWGFVQIVGLALPGNPWTGEVWFLNPFGWQFCFMLGFSFANGWLPAPRWRDPRLLALSIAICLIAFPLSFQPLVDRIEVLRAVQAVILPASAKTDLAPVRIVHFLALAYVTLSIVAPFATRLDMGPGAPFVRIGRQSLAAFVVSIIAAELGGFVLMELGDGVTVTAVVNLAGFLTIFTAATIVSWFKREPWSKPATPLAER